MRDRSLTYLADNYTAKEKLLIPMHAPVLKECVDFDILIYSDLSANMIRQ